MNAAPSIAPDSPPPATMLSAKHEQFVGELMANGGNISAAYKTIYPGVSRATAFNNGCRLRARSDVSSRIAQFQALAAERTIITARDQLIALAEMAAVDVSELWWLEYRPCPACIKLYDADLAARRPMPDLNDGLPPHPSCTDVRAHQHVHLTPMEQWPAAARKLYDGLEMQRDGTMRPVFRDRSRID